MKCSTEPRPREGFLAWPKHRKKDMIFGTWDVSSLYKTGLLKTVARKLGKYKLDLAGVQEVRWDKGALNGQRIIHFSTKNALRIIS
jgi:hypothetical protein